jgi:hypothetical protein
MFLRSGAQGATGAQGSVGRQGGSGKQGSTGKQGPSGTNATAERGGLLAASMLDSVAEPGTIYYSLTSMRLVFMDRKGKIFSLTGDVPDGYVKFKEDSAGPQI